MASKKVKDRAYQSSLEEIKQSYQESKDWFTVFETVVYNDVRESNEAFIDYLEEVEQTKIKDVKHLQELTGVDYVTDTYIKGKKVTAKDETQQKEFALKELEETLITGRASKYSRAMETALLEGAKYEDLLKIKAQDYGLPETDKNGKSYQYATILDVISWEYLLMESFAVRPDLRTVAKDLEAPYSLVLNAWKLRQY